MVLDQVQAGDKQLELLETEPKRLASGEVFFFCGETVVPGVASIWQLNGFLYLRDMQVKVVACLQVDSAIITACHVQLPSQLILRFSLTKLRYFSYLLSLNMMTQKWFDSESCLSAQGLISHKPPCCFCIDWYFDMVFVILGHRPIMKQYHFCMCMCVSRRPSLGTTLPLIKYSQENTFGTGTPYNTLARYRSVNVGGLFKLCLSLGDRLKATTGLKTSVYPRWLWQPTLKYWQRVGLHLICGEHIPPRYRAIYTGKLEAFGKNLFPLNLCQWEEHVLPPLSSPGIMALPPLDHHGSSIYSGHYTASINCCKKHSIATITLLRSLKLLRAKTFLLHIDWLMSFGPEQQKGSLIAPMALTHPLHPILIYIYIFIYKYAFFIWVLL